MAAQDPKNPDFMNIVKAHKWDFISYVILAIGLFLSIYYPFTGGLLVGLVLGVYFASTFKEWFWRFKADLATDGIFRDFVILAGVLALLISSFGMCVGVVIGTIIQPLFPEI